ncbi:unnamed protein product [Bursaphelenchus xylophilus]|uniref:(pine wood nematode) hypothetical protein n=1 Tax=Bursaphelenchus xylophilus TaxID=6326 RepID=A0A1I7RNR3_BURXY|nr:unnamed protein product [Bursaphelenchus xylophilus]CAG9124236.1 unnamed protein product [Bursaphelenchus xylophilus]
MRLLAILVLFVLLISGLEARSRLKKDDDFMRSPGMSNRVRRYDTILGATPKRIRRMLKEKIRAFGVV